MTNTNKAAMTPGKPARLLALPGALAVPVVNPSRPGRRAKNIVSISPAMAKRETRQRMATARTLRVGGAHAEIARALDALRDVLLRMNFEERLRISEILKAFALAPDSAVCKRDLMECMAPAIGRTGDSSPIAPG